MNMMYGNRSSAYSQMGVVPQDKALDFILAGKCECVLHSTKTGEDFKYKITRKETKENSYIWFVSCNGQYAGVLWYDIRKGYQYSQGKSGKISSEDLAIKSLMFVIRRLASGNAVQYLEVYHVGRCGVCGKKLTDPESIMRGIGPTCAKRVGAPRI